MAAVPTMVQMFGQRLAAHRGMSNDVKVCVSHICAGHIDAVAMQPDDEAIVFDMHGGSTLTKVGGKVGLDWRGL